MQNIFLFGPMGAGKDAVAEMLVNDHGYWSTALADGIRSYITQNNPSYIPKSSRALEIEVGEKHREWFGRDYWCKSTAGSIDVRKWVIDDGKPVVIRDGRFPHEYDFFVKQRGFVPVAVRAKDEVRIKRLTGRDGKLDMNHFYSANDCPIINYPAFVIQNDGEILQVLRSKVFSTVAQIREQGGRL